MIYHSMRYIHHQELNLKRRMQSLFLEAMTLKVRSSSYALIDFDMLLARGNSLTLWNGSIAKSNFMKTLHRAS